MSVQVKLWQSVAITVVISALTGSMGFSISQLQLGNTVAVLDSRVGNVENIMRGYETRSTEHMNQAIDLFKEQAGLFKEQVKVQTEFIQTIKVQNELLMKFSR